MRKMHYVELPIEAYKIIVRVVTFYDKGYDYDRDGGGQPPYLSYEWELVNVFKNNRVIPRPESLTDQKISDLISEQLQNQNIDYEN